MIQGYCNIDKMKIWHLILYNVFFSFIGSYIAREIGGGYIVKHTADIFTSLLFIFFLLFFIRELKQLIFGIEKHTMLLGIVCGFLVGSILWFTMIFFVPLTPFILDKCTLDTCEVFSKNYSIITNNFTFSSFSFGIIVVMILRFSLVTPLVEELLYRAAMPLLLKNRFSPMLCAFVVAIIFSLFHAKYLLYFFCFSLLMSALTLTFKNILPAVIAHSTYNFLIYFIYPSRKLFRIPDDFGYQEAFFTTFLVITLFMIAIFFIRKSSRTDSLKISIKNHI